MDPKQADYIFMQVQEMFPQLEANVIYLILSENDFKSKLWLQFTSDITSTGQVGLLYLCIASFPPTLQSVG